VNNLFRVTPHPGHPQTECIVIPQTLYLAFTRVTVVHQLCIIWCRYLDRDIWLVLYLVILSCQLTILWVTVLANPHALISEILPYTNYILCLNSGSERPIWLRLTRVRTLITPITRINLSWFFCKLYSFAIWVPSWVQFKSDQSASRLTFTRDSSFLSRPRVNSCVITHLLHWKVRANCNSTGTSRQHVLESYRNCGHNASVTESRCEMPCLT